MNNLFLRRECKRSLLVIALVAVFSLLTYQPVQASDGVEESDIVVSENTDQTLEIGEAGNVTVTEGQASSSKVAKDDFSSGFKSMGRGFKNGTKATGKGFKTAGTTMGKGFKKAGTSMAGGFKWMGRKIKGIFVRDKSPDQVEERDLMAADTQSAESETADETNQDLEAIGNEKPETGDEVEVDTEENNDWVKHNSPTDVTS